MVSRWFIQTISVGTPINPYFAGAVATFVHGKNQKVIFSDLCDLTNDVNALATYGYKTDGKAISEARKLTKCEVKCDKMYSRWVYRYYIVRYDMEYVDGKLIVVNQTQTELQ